MPDTLQAAADEIKNGIAGKAEEIKASPEMAELLRLLKALNALEDVLGVPLSSAGQMLGLAEPKDEEVKPGEFYGLSPLEAAKRFLKKRGEARPFDEILNAVRVGGGVSVNERDLRISLARSTWEIAKVGADVYGLLEFYPHVKRGKKQREGGGPAEVEEVTHPEQAEVEVAEAGTDDEATKS